MQRVHEDDLAGHVAGDSAWTHLNLPMEYEPTTFVSPLGWTDPRKAEGDLLWPERMDAAFVSAQKRTLGSYAYAGQYQQRPTPAEGGILKRHWFGTYAQPERYLAIIQSWDTAFKDGRTADYSACVTLGVGLNFVDVLDVYRARVEFPDLERALEDQHLAASARYPGVPITVLVEDKGSGQSLIQVARRRGNRNLNVIAVSASRPDEKVQRVHDISPSVEAGKVRLPAHAHWLDSFVDEVVSFPLGSHDDMVDAFSVGAGRAFGVGPDAAGIATSTSAWPTAPRSPHPVRRRL